MARSSSVSMNIEKMNSLIEGLKTKATIQVGVFEKNTARKEAGMTNAAVAEIHELGSPSHNIPARSFLKIPLADHRDEIINVFKGKAESFLKAGTLINLYKLVGIQCEKIVDGAFNSGGYGKWAPLRYETILGKLRKGHRNLHWRKLTIAHIYAGNIGMGILIATSQLRRSISSRVRMTF